MKRDDLAILAQRREPGGTDPRARAGSLIKNIRAWQISKSRRTAFAGAALWRGDRFVAAFALEDNPATIAADRNRQGAAFIARRRPVGEGHRIAVGLTGV